MDEGPGSWGALGGTPKALGIFRAPAVGWQWAGPLAGNGLGQRRAAAA